jgi:hypothetical protein
LKKAHKISLKPYPGELYFTNTKELLIKTQKKISGEDMIVDDGNDGLCVSLQSSGRETIYIVYASHIQALVHEMGHVALRVFLEISSDPRAGNGEPFCYLLDDITYEASKFLNK